jgi:hypothetical protein
MRYKYLNRRWCSSLACLDFLHPIVPSPEYSEVGMGSMETTTHTSINVAAPGGSLIRADANRVLGLRNSSALVMHPTRVDHAPQMAILGGAEPHIAGQRFLAHRFPLFSYIIFVEPCLQSVRFWSTSLRSSCEQCQRGLFDLWKRYFLPGRPELPVSAYFAISHSTPFG